MLTKAEKKRISMVVRRAWIKGEIEKTPCEKCGEKIVDAHHDDYSKPLEVRWLCRKHHMEHHAITKRRGLEP